MDAKYDFVRVFEIHVCKAEDWSAMRSFSKTADYFRQSFFEQTLWPIDHFYCAMHYSAKRGIAIACRQSVGSVRLSVCPSVWDVGGSGSHRLEILETNYTHN